MQLNTFFCRQGVDSNVRFALITIVSVLLVSLFDLLLAGHGFIIFLALGAALVASLSAWRRLQGQKSPLFLLPGGALLLLGLAYSFNWPILLGFSVLLALVAIVLILRRPMPVSSFQGDGLGYRGPRMTASNLRATGQRRRVEPRFAYDEAVDTASFVADDFTVATPNEQAPSEHARYVFDDAPLTGAGNTDAVHGAAVQGGAIHNAADENEEAGDRGYNRYHEPSQSGSLSELLSTWGGLLARLVSDILLYLKTYPKAAIVTCVALVLFTSAWLIYPSGDNSEVQTAQSQPSPQTMAQSQENALVKTATMPDGFSVLLEGDALALSWLGERGEPGLIWSLATAKGDRSCQALTFNDGTQYRPIEVNLLANTSTVARFSPLDTQAIIKDIAMRGSLKLCGYQFSLKGSQAALAKEAAFRPYL
ncbi:hypothetical protein LZP69_14335 [Shewanella sp. AS1]|uniref:hypothetical protein n=1 Tax=Shewanella sp. AS1 TaxID=2907626 RepID=UPI001F41E2FB|nr:hypothetical protein [Shewanella sp. AS1]MCE9680333.1 hypothetical protein [Shewanella sp. AS1]